MKYTQTIVIVLTLLCSYLELSAQKHKVSGVIKEAHTQKKLSNVSVRERYTQTEVYSNEEGYFEMELETKLVHLKFNLNSYHSQKVSFILAKDTIIEVILEPFTIDEVEILGRETSSETSINKLSINLDYYNRLPSLIGESDPLKTLTLFPGIQSAMEGSSGLVVRGGYPGQNLIRLDGMTLYNPYHLLGITSTFNSDAVQSLDLYKGMFPARFGNRIASVIDLNTDSKQINKRKRKASIGLLSSRVVLKDSLPNQLGDYMIAGRASYLSLVTLPILLRYRVQKNDYFFGYYLYDLNGKLNFQTKKAGKFKLSGFLGQDYLNGREGQFKQDEDQESLLWGNNGLNLTHTASLGKRFKTQSSISYSNYIYNRNYSEIKVLQDTTLTFEISSRYGLSDIGADFMISDSISPNINIKAGVGINRLGFFRENQLNQIRRDHNMIFNQWIDADISIKNLTIQPGIRFVQFPYQNSTFFSAEPRVNLALQLGEKTQLSASAGKVSQALHLVSGTNLGLPNDIWIPASKALPAQTGLQYAMGFKLGKEDSDFQFHLEGYYRKAYGMPLYRPEEIELELIVDDRITENFVTGGKAESMGLEAFFKYQSPRWQAWASYTLSKSTQQFDEIQGGKKLLTPFDQRHNLQLVSNFQISKKWQMSNIWVFQTGRPFSLPSSSYFDQNGRRVYIYPEKISRLPFYHRMDIGFTYEKNPDAANQKKWKFGVYNLYNRKNPTFLDIDVASSGTRNGQVIPRPGKVTGQTLLPFMPYLSYEWNF